MAESKGKKRIKPSFSLGQVHYDLLKEIADKTRRPMAEEMRIMIEKRAKELGMQLDPNCSAPALVSLN